MNLNEHKVGLCQDTYQSPLLHALHHHEENLLRLSAAVVEGFLDGDQQLISDAVTHQPVQRNTQLSCEAVEVEH